MLITRPPARPSCRDYVNPYLPVGPTAGDDTLPIQAPLNVSPIESSVLLCTVDNAQYPVTVEAVHQVFSPYGLVHKIAIFERNDSWQVGSGHVVVGGGEPGWTCAARGCPWLDVLQRGHVALPGELWRSRAGQAEGQHPYCNITTRTAATATTPGANAASSPLLTALLPPPLPPRCWCSTPMCTAP
jgi:hypothetical protein